jgi:hypothetical protein
MNLANPVTTFTTSVDADVLDVLARTTGPLTGVDVQRRAKRSHAQVRDVLHRLSWTGLVTATRAGQSVLYELNREHVLAASITLTAFAAQGVEWRLAELLPQLDPPPVDAIVFGPFARRQGDVHTPIDVLLIRPAGVAADYWRWIKTCRTVQDRVQLWSGNECHVVEHSLDDLRRLPADALPILADARSVVDGQPVSKAELLARVPA